ENAFLVVHGSKAYIQRFGVWLMLNESGTTAHNVCGLPHSVKWSVRIPASKTVKAPPDKELVGTRLRDLLERRHMSAADLARRMADDVSPQMVAGWAAGAGKIGR